MKDQLKSNKCTVNIDASAYTCMRAPPPSVCAGCTRLALTCKPAFYPVFIGTAHDFVYSH